MATIHVLIPSTPIRVTQLGEILKTFGDANLWHYKDSFEIWIPKKSTRGVTFDHCGDTIEIKNNVLSNNADYELTNRIVARILKLHGGEVRTEEDELVPTEMLFSERQMRSLMGDECDTIMRLSTPGNEVSIPGIVRPVYFGSFTHEAFKDLDDAALVHAMMELFLKVNYGLPDYLYGNVMDMTNSQNKIKTAKLITNNEYLILDKYDFIFLNTEKPEPVIITNQS